MRSILMENELVSVNFAIMLEVSFFACIPNEITSEQQQVKWETTAVKVEHSEQEEFDSGSSVYSH